MLAIGFVCLLFSSAASGQTASADYWDRFEFKGNEAFTTTQLRDALLADPDFLLAAHPLAAYVCSEPIWKDTTELWKKQVPEHRWGDPELRSGLEKLIAGGLLAPVDAIVKQWGQGRAEERFFVPSEPPKGADWQSLMRMAGAAMGSLTEAERDALASRVSDDAVRRVMLQWHEYAGQHGSEPSGAVY